MKVSYNWLKEYIVGDVPPVPALVDALTMHSFEIEGVEEKDGDFVLDIKILPNRAHDCLSHYGIAGEISAVCGLAKQIALAPAIFPDDAKLKVSVDTKNVSRAVMIHFSGIKNDRETPEWMVKKLALLGQRSVNPVVDITNYLMYSFGQPVHAFDARSVATNKKGERHISIRNAEEGEKVTLLNDTEYTLDPSVTVIADGDKALDVAGIMGGKNSGVQKDTTDIILSLSTFDAVSIRKTAKKLGIRTDASLRFENDISSTLIDRTLPYALKLIADITEGAPISFVDTVVTKPVHRKILTTIKKINSVLGIDIDTDTAITLLRRVGLETDIIDDKIAAYVPLERLDIELEEHIAEEVGRLYGLSNIGSRTPDNMPVTEWNKSYYVATYIRQTLVSLGFSEVYTYTFRGSGDVEIQNPLSKDKRFLRKDLISAMEEALDHNFKFLDLLGHSEVKLFEVGTVFRDGGESLRLSIGVRLPKGKHKENADQKVSNTITTLRDKLGLAFGNISVVGGIAEINLTALLETVTPPTVYPSAMFSDYKREVSYTPISPYPFAVRDVAVFVPESVGEGEVREMIQIHMTDIVVRWDLFDVFSKEFPEGKKTSYAYRIVFQAKDRTLTDDEINGVMNPIYDTLKSKEGFEVR